MNRLLQILFLVLIISSFANSKITPKEPIKIKPIEKEINVKNSIEAKQKTGLKIQTIVGEKLFDNTHKMGIIGDRVSTKRLTGMGYEKLRSKTTSIHGIDGIYHKKENGISKILIVENKVNSSQLSINSRGVKQMSDVWLKEKVNEMMGNDAKRTRNAGKLIKDNLEKYPSRIEKQIWNYDFSTGKTEVWIVDKNANYISNKPKWVWEKDKILIDKLNELK